jgi:hypothetical protein
MPDPLRPMKTFFGNTLACVSLAALPIAILDGMWSNPDTRDFARNFDGSVAMWISMSLYLLLILILWIRLVTRHDPREK